MNKVLDKYLKRRCMSLTTSRHSGHCIDFDCEFSKSVAVAMELGQNEEICVFKCVLKK